MTNSGMIMRDGAGTAVKTSAGSLRAAVLAMLRKSCWCADLSSVFLFVTRNTQSFSVVDICYQFGVFCNWLYVMGVHIVTAFSASLASVAIASIDGIAPFCQVSRSLGALTMQRFSTFPCSSSFSYQWLSTARPGAESRSFVATIKRLTAVFAISCYRWVSMRPTFFGAKARCGSPVRLDRVGRSAQFANLDYPRVFHGFIILHSTLITKQYCAVAIQRWVDMTGGVPELLD